MAGSKFKALTAKLSTEKKVTNPAGLAASIGRKKFGPQKFEAMSAAGKQSKTASMGAAKTAKKIGNKGF